MAGFEVSTEGHDCGNALFPGTSLGHMPFNGSRTVDPLAIDGE